jgi:predicted acyl esterase
VGALPRRGGGREDTIACGGGLPGSNGKVGMWGFSYAGATQLLPATRRPPALAAICPR